MEDEIPGEPHLSERFVRVALEHGAIAPLWEADTARLQTANRLNDAGLTEEDWAAKAGRLAAHDTDGSKTFRPVELDLDGDGKRSTADLLANDTLGRAARVRLYRMAYRTQKPLSLQSCPKWAANDPEHRAAA